MDEIEVINILKRYSDKKTEREGGREGETDRQTDRKSSSFFILCCDLAISSTFLVCSKLYV